MNPLWGNNKKSQQMKYNALLLSTPSSTESIADAISQLSEEEKQKLLVMLKMQSVK